MTDKKWFVIEKTSYGTSGDNFAISKVADTVEQATTFKVHLDALNESKNKIKEFWIDLGRNNFEKEF